MIDADGSADAGEIPSFVSDLLNGADFAKGTRFARGGGSEDITRLRGLGNRMLTGLVNLLYGTKYTDLCYGFNVFWRKHLSALGFDAATILPTDNSGCLRGDGFESETLINMRLAAAALPWLRFPASNGRLGGLGIDRNQGDNGDGPASATLVGGKDRVTAHLFSVSVVAFAAIQLGGVYVENPVADLDLGVRVGEQVVVPARVAIRSSLGCKDQIAAIIGNVHHRVDTVCRGAGPNGMQQE